MLSQRYIFTYLEENNLGTPIILTDLDISTGEHSDYHLAMGIGPSTGFHGTIQTIQNMVFLMATFGLWRIGHGKNSTYEKNIFNKHDSMHDFKSCKSDQIYCRRF